MPIKIRLLLERTSLHLLVMVTQSCAETNLLEAIQLPPTHMTFGKAKNS